MKKLIYSIMALAALTSCVKNEFDTRAEYPIDLSVTFETKAGGSDATTEPIVNSMRVLIFYGNPSASETQGNLVFNTFYAFGFNTVKGTGKYTVNLANQIVLPQSTCRNYNVYVVLNEEGFTLPGVSPADLHTTLGDFVGTETQLQAILSTPAVYTDVLKNVDEPAFLIGGYKAVTFEDGELGSGKPVTIDGKNGFNRGRSMAQIVINKITSEPSDGIDYQSSDVPKIFVKSVTLENVPNAISWSNDDGKIGTVGTTTVSAMSDPIQVGAANTDGYYTREWYGHVTRTITNLYAQKVQYTDAKFYRTGNNDAGNTAWSFNVKPYRSTDDTPGPGTAPYTFSYAQGDDVTPALTNEQKKENVFGGWTEKYNNDTKNLLNTALPYVFNALQDDNDEMSENITYTSYEVTGVQNKADAGKTKTSIGPATMSDDEYWTVRLGDKFYVPENIQNAATNATCLHVTLAIANPMFSFSLNKEDKIADRVCTEDMDTEAKVSKGDYKAGYHFVDPTTLPSPSSLPGESSLTYTYYAGDSESGTLKSINEIDKNWIKANCSIVWADDESHVLEPTSYRKYKGDGSFDKFLGTFSDGHGQFYTYIDGFSRRTAAVQSSIVVNETLKGSSFSWNVPAGPDNSTTNDIHIFEYIIPINNNIDNNGDYSVRRNTKYTVTLYVTPDTYDDGEGHGLVTKSGASAPFSITAKVTTETVSDYEE